ncbi:hypothetical protein G3545_08730 [Starkeya sp. ORNL1]|nr:hypothetical protein G3545_08730 [Starkeya sp. ORNL1]
MVGPQSTERVAGFGVTPARVPGGLDPAQGDGLWPNAAAGFSEVVYNALGGTADDRADSINDQIDQVNFLLGRNDPYIAEDQILGSRWFATKAEDWLEVPDPARIRAVTGWEKAARVGGVAAASLVALLLATRGSGTATRTPSLPNVQPLGPGGNPPGGAPGAPSQAGRAFTGGRVAADDTARTAGGLVATTKPEQAYGGRSVDAFDSSDTSILPKPYQDAASVISTGKELPPRQVLYHYTDERGLNGITTSNYLNPSLWYAGTKDVRYGNGQYVSDIVPGTRTPEELSAAFLRSPYQGHRFTHYIEIDATDLGAINGRPGVYVIPNEKPLDLTRRILRNGRVPGK